MADGPSRGQLLPGPCQKTSAGPQSNSLNSCPTQKETSPSSWRWSDSGFEQQVVESGQAGEDSSETSEASVGARGQGGDSQEEALYPAIAVEGGGQCWIESEEQQADSPGREECFQRSAAPIWSTFEEVREFLPGGRHQLRRVSGRFLGSGVHSRKGIMRRREASGSSRVQVRQPAWEVGSQSQGKRLYALKLLLDHDTYLRPGESIDLKGRDIVLPVKGAARQYQWYAVIVRNSLDAKPDKVGVFDNTVILNSKGREFFGPPDSPPGQGVEVPRAQALSLRCSAVQESFCGGRGDVEPGCSSPLPDTAWGSSRRPQRQRARPRQCQTAWPLDDRSKCTTVHKN